MGTNGKLKVATGRFGNGTLAPTGPRLDHKPLSGPRSSCGSTIPAASIDLLRGTARYDLAWTESFDFVYPAYIRGLAYLQLGDGRSAATQFQKMIDNRGLTLRHVIGPLAWLQLGRAQKMMGDEAAARKSYETFLDLWKTDPDIPIYQRAKAEYANL